MRFYRWIVILLVLVLAFGITGLAEVQECHECIPAHDTGAGLSECTESNVGAKESTAAAPGECDPDDLFDCEEDTTTKIVYVDIYECTDQGRYYCWVDTGEDEPIDMDNCSQDPR